MQRLIFSALLFLAPIFCKLAAQRTLRGKVTEAMTGLPVPGATVRVVGYEGRAVSDKNGSYAIEVPKAATELAASHPAFREKRSKISALSTLNFSLSADLSLFKVKGAVLNAATGKPIPGAKLEYVRSKTMHQTDEKGQFSVSVAARSVVFKISATGFQTLTRTLEAGENNAVRLDPEVQAKPKAEPPVVTALPAPKKDPAASAANVSPKRTEIRSKPADTVQSNASPEPKTGAESAASPENGMPWWNQAQYMVPIMVAFIGGFFSLLQTWLASRK